MTEVTISISRSAIEELKKQLLQALTPMVPYKIDPLEFCRAAHEVKDEHIRNICKIFNFTLE